MIRAALLAGALLAACTPVQRDQVTRDAARSVVGRVLATRLPDLPIEPIVDCAVDNATSDELRFLASETVTGPTAAATQTVTLILLRQQTLQCIDKTRPA